MSEITTRPATQDDVFIMEHIMRAAFEASYANFMPEQYIREWYDNNEASRAVAQRLKKSGVAILDGDIIGWVAHDDSTVPELWVDPNYQQQGAGRALIEWIEAEFRKFKFPALTLYCYEKNTEALEFYKKLRFRRASQFMSKDVPGGPVVVYNMLKMIKNLKK